MIIEPTQEMKEYVIESEKVSTHGIEEIIQESQEWNIAHRKKGKVEIKIYPYLYYFLIYTNDLLPLVDDPHKKKQILIEFGG